MMGMPMQAPSRCTLGKIGSSPTKVTAPPVSSGQSPSSFIRERKRALTSKLEVVCGVAKVLLLILFPSIDNRYLEPAGGHDSSRCRRGQSRPPLQVPVNSDAVPHVR